MFHVLKQREGLLLFRCNQESLVKIEHLIYLKVRNFINHYVGHPLVRFERFYFENLERFLFFSCLNYYYFMCNCAGNCLIRTQNWCLLKKFWSMFQLSLHVKPPSVSNKGVHCRAISFSLQNQSFGKNNVKNSEAKPKLSIFQKVSLAVPWNGHQGCPFGMIKPL